MSDKDYAHKTLSVLECISSKGQNPDIQGAHEKVVAAVEELVGSAD